MTNLIKTAFFLTFTASGFVSQAQVRENTTEKESVTLISENVAEKAASETKELKAIITKAERQEIGGLRNFYKIDEGLYRSEQPDQNDFIALEKMGIAEILNVRRLWSDNKKARHTDLKLHHISMKAGDIKEREVIRALKIINKKTGPVLIHCWHGADRTGMLIAMYRTVFQNWTKDDAIHEMTKGNFGFHSAYSNIIDFVRDADIEKIREKVLGKDEAEKIPAAVVTASNVVPALPGAGL